MKTWQCTECGYIHEGVKPPRLCPECDAPALAFDLLEEDLGDWDDDWDEDWDDDWDDDFDDDFDDDWDEQLTICAFHREERPA